MSRLGGIRDKILKNDFYSFLVKTFHTINPNTEFLPNWHIRLIAEYLQAAEKGDVKRLVINLPPRSLKSLIVSVAWPAWLLGQDSARRIIGASYAQGLSVKHALDCRRVVTSEWYGRIFPKFRLAKAQNQKSKFMTTSQGYRIATSVGGSITGEGGNFLIIDDPHNPIHINSMVKRQKVIEWFDKTFSTRLDDKKKGVIILVMQRLHQEDLSGYLLEKGWDNLVLPAIAREKKVYKLGKLEINREAGEFLQSARENALEMARAKEDLGSGGFAAQYQQDPISFTGNIIKPEWLRRYSGVPVITNCFQSWDTAIKINDTNDYSVCTSWAEGEGGYYLLDVFRARLEYPFLKKEVMNQAAKWKPEAILIEDKASGQSLIQDLKKERHLPIIPIKVQLGKIVRAVKVSCLIEAGKVFLPQKAEWLADYEKELFTFPAVKHDDQIDSTSQFLEWRSSKSIPAPMIRNI